MKVNYRISTGQFEYVEVEEDYLDSDMSPSVAETIRVSHEQLKYAFKPQPVNSLPEKEWKRFIERILQGEPNHIDELEKCSPNQKLVINAVKKALKRLEARSGHERWLDNGTEDGRPTKSDQD